ncbi:MAG: YbjQ family protein [Thermomicrobiales bacterium]|nr:YbjQ family protein [Thermomicrobiales bacterium]
MSQVVRYADVPTPDDLLVVTTDAIEGHPVREYLAIVAGDAIVEIPVQRAHEGTHRHAPSATLLQRRLSEGRSRAISAMVRRAKSLGATAIIAMDVRYTNLSDVGANLIVVAVSGTAVTI